MKVLLGLMFFVLLGVHAQAQHDAKVIAEIAAGHEKMIKNAPFSAEAVSESVQTLADGNRIVRSSTSKMYRNSEGRFRREIAGGVGGMLGSHFSYGQGISILDPVAGHRVMLDSLGKTARLLELHSGQGVSIAGRAGVISRKELTDAQRAELENKIASAKNMTEEQRTAIRAQLANADKFATEVRATAPLIALSGSGQGVHTITSTGDGFALATTTNGNYETRSEELGTRDFEGVSAEGTRKITTIPAGAIGNERPIEITYERWYSKELGLVVYSKTSDPRFGEQTYRLTNIVRSEPDPSLFTVPQGYKVLAEPASVYRLHTKPSMPAQSASAPRAAKAPTAVSVKNTQP